jgi:NADPH2 dehydrogenase
MTDYQEKPNLFKPLQVGRMRVLTRVALAPLSRSRAPNHQVTELHAEYYSQRASRAGTLLITEAVFISAAAAGFTSSPGIYKQAHIEGWRQVFTAIHAKHSFVFVQLWALGRAAQRETLAAEGLPYVAPALMPQDLRPENAATAPRALTREEIKQYIADWVQAARNAITAGADGVEIHAANGFLLDQFLHANTNCRQDEYGGSIENRARLVLEVVDAVCAAVGADRVGIRISPWGNFGEVDPGFESPVAQWSYLLAELQRRADAGQELAYVSTIDMRDDAAVAGAANGADERVITSLQRDVRNRDFARLTWRGVLIRASGYNYERACHETALDPRLLIAVGRLFIATPDLADRWERKIPLNRYRRESFYTMGAVGYTDYPFANELVARDDKPEDGNVGPETKTMASL